MASWQTYVFGRSAPQSDPADAVPLARITGLLVLVLLCLGALFVLAYTNASSLMRDNARVKETYRVLAELDQLRLDIKDVESRTRAYLLLGQASDAARIRQIRQALAHRLDLLQQLARFQPLQWAELEQEVKQQLDFAETLMSLRQGTALRPRIQALANPETRFFRLENLILAQRQVLAQQLAAEQGSGASVLTGIVLTGVIALGVLGLTVWLMLRDLLFRLQAERQLREAYAQAADLAEFSHALNQQPDLSGCLQTLITTYAPLFHQTPYAVLSYDPADDCLCLLAHNDPELPLANGCTLGLESHPPLQYSIATGHILHQDHGPRPEPSDSPFNGTLCIPMLQDQEVIGVLTLRQPPGQPVSLQTLHHLRQIATHLASALRRALQYEAIRQLAQRDELTQCYSRRYFFEQMELAILRSQNDGTPLTLLMLDVDHFKAINDRCGHLAGDRVLCQLAQLLESALGQLDLLCRYGGEEFAMLLPGTALSEGFQLAERLRSRIAAYNWLESVQQPVTISIGLAQWWGESVDTFVHRADCGLYAAKAAGRNCCRAEEPSKPQIL